MEWRSPLKTIKIVLYSVFGTLLGLAAVLLVVMFTGTYDVAATAPHTSLTRWALGRLQHASVAARATEVRGTLPTDPAALREGLEHYDEMCATCHGAPGVLRGEIGQGMNPEPPDLSEEAEDWSDAELFWIVKHGIKLAGMPAFGPTHSDEQIWDLVGFVRQLPEMTGSEYQQRVKELEASEAGSAGQPPEPADGS
jgi:mono/diheme cytochrome c family protein